jgi:enoyl-CoA hydratase/carnithine racemase
MTASDPLLVHDEDGVRVLTLNRPQVLNAVDPALGAALHRALVAADTDSDVRCLLLTAIGERAFSAGGDLKAMAASDGPTMGGGSRAITEALQYRPGKPVLAAVNGLAYGGGLELLLACDLAVCAEHATFALPEVRRGILASGGGLVRLPRVVGPRRALQLILTGAPIDAATALDWGLVNQVVASGTELDAAMTLARAIAANAPVSLELSKQTAYAAMTVTDEEAWRVNTEALAAIRRSPDAREGPRAFAEGRPPVWTGLRE